MAFGITLTLGLSSSGLLGVLSVTVDSGTVENLLSDGSGGVTFDVVGGDYPGSYAISAAELAVEVGWLVDPTTTESPAGTFTVNADGLSWYTDVAPIVSVVWERNGVPISGATTSSYTIQAADNGQLVEAVVSLVGQTASNVDEARIEVQAATNPEAGLTVTDTYAEGDTIVGTNTVYNTTQSVVVACEYTGATGNGHFFDIGGASIGFAFGMDASNNFIAVVQHSGSSITIQGPDSLVLGDHTVVFEVDTSANTLRMWIDGVEQLDGVGGVTITTSGTVTSWAGANDSVFFSGIQSSSAGTASGIVDFGSLSVDAGAEARIYENQTALL